MSDQHSKLSLEEPSTSQQLRARNFKDRHYEQSVEHMLSEIIGGDDGSLSGFGSDDTDVDPNYKLSDHLSDSEQKMDHDPEQNSLPEEDAPVAIHNLKTWTNLTTWSSGPVDGPRGPTDRQRGQCHRGGRDGYYSVE